MLPLSLLPLCLGVAHGLSLPRQEAENGPAPIALGFSVLKTVGNITAKEFWSQHSAERAKRDGYPIPIVDYRDISYRLDVYLGSDAQKSTVNLDTGSSDLWVYSSDYDPSTSSTSKDTGDAFSIGYLDGTSSAGEYYLDTLKFSTPNPVLSSFQFARSTSSSAYGVLGIADRNQERALSEYDNLPWALQAAGITPKASYSLFLGAEGGSGTVIFGGIDTEKYVGNLTKYSAQKSRGALAVNLQTMLVNGKTLSVDAPAILDSGTSLGLLPLEYMSELDSVFDTTVYTQGSIEYRLVSCDQPSDKYLDFDFGNNTIQIAYSDMVYHQGNDECLLGFGSYGSYMIFGDVFLRQAYVYYDLSDLTISLAQASYSSSSNIISA
ncbi:acid protease [Metschnikowia bicuspidata var. bicuspidata NRRL YB-4993]|uniref:candidapepsin n=1 Tax=Metschnikowia bicuspidata var. bicuspidata NRRL YB-4993 TaxID=869754 RepID=A0A1A0HFL3_9ASCO|nr:acid protease [Metschnikowia bicuspidata var. bicuspidata NRRL YB-4993]OBA22791.1 acid protease [Metschnikowia bicuspidata var. bicuspidata NRRL YB-4993]